jgi:hypothetical protein
MSVTMFAQENSCPVQPNSVLEHASEIAVSLQNSSDKAIASYRIGLTARTINGHSHPLPDDFTDRVQLPARAQRTAIWHTPLAYQFALPLAQVYLLEVTFVDGTDWVDDGSHSCAVTSVQE